MVNRRHKLHLGTRGALQVLLSRGGGVGRTHSQQYYAAEFAG